jgi:septum formation protein
MRLILASQSPRRAELLAAAGIAHDVVPVEVDERVLPAESPADCVRRLALAKAREVARRNPGRGVLGADTVVVVGARILGKPSDDAEARNMLEMLSGQTHEVLTGVALCLGGREKCEAVTTRVRFLQLSPAAINWYVASGEPRDKAGAYAVQGLASRFVDRIEGSYANVVGLPVSTVCLMLNEFGLLDGRAI